MKIKGTKVLVTGTSRGIGRAFVAELLARGAGQVLAGARTADDLAAVGALDPRVTPVQLDVTRPGDVEAAAGRIGELDLLLNNAGSLRGYSLLATPRGDVERDFAVNFWGTLELTKALVPALERRRGAVLNILTLVSMASMAGIGGYSASKAAAWSMTQALRAELGARGITVFAAYPGAVDTDMIRSFEMAKTPPAEVARNALDAVEAGTLDAFPDPMSAQAGAAWLKNPRDLEAMFAKM